MQALLALLPVLLLAALMIFFKWGLVRAASLALLISILFAYVFFGAGPTLLAFAIAKSFLLGLYASYIIVAGVLLYNLVDSAGGIEAIALGLSRVARDQVLQVLVFAWTLASLLQGVAGFGVPIAVVSPMLVTLGLKPDDAVAASAMGHAWAVTFGSMATSFLALVLVTGMHAPVLAHWSAIFLGISSIIAGFFVALTYGGSKAIRHGFLAIALIGTSMAVSLYITAAVALSYLAASIVSGAVGLLTALALSKLPLYSHEDNANKSSSAHETRLGFHSAFSPYYALIALSLILGFPSSISKALSGLAIVTLPFPSTSTELGWVNKAVSSYSPIPILTHPGSIVLYATAFAYILFRRKQLLKPGSIRRILDATMRDCISGVNGIFLVSGIALVLNESGMSFELARSTSEFAGFYYPIFAALIGAFGCFTTGSNTASNTLFGLFQKEVSQLINANPSIVVSAQTTGGSVASMISPAKVAVGSTTLGIPGREGYIMRRTFIPLLTTVVVIGILTQILAFHIR